MMDFMAHAGTERIDRSKLQALPGPSGTKTWVPVAHGEIVNVIEACVEDAGMTITREEFSVNGNGARMFGLISVDYCGDGAMTGAIGLRQGLDKSMSLGLVGGTRVFVCDNMAFMGEEEIKRRHTRQMENIVEIVAEMVERVKGSIESFYGFHNQLRAFPLPERRAETLAFNCFRAGVLPEGKFSELNRLYFRKQGDIKYEDSLFGFHGAVTQILSRGSRTDMIGRNRKLNNILTNYRTIYSDEVMDVLAA